MISSRTKRRTWSISICCSELGSKSMGSLPSYSSPPPWGEDRRGGNDGRNPLCPPLARVSGDRAGGLPVHNSPRQVDGSDVGEIGLSAPSVPKSGTPPAERANSSSPSSRIACARPPARSRAKSAGRELGGGQR